MNNTQKSPLDRLQNEYQQIPIPEELTTMIKNTIQREAQETRTRKRRSIWRNAALTAAAAAAVFVGSINLSPTAATALADVPVLGALVEVFTFRGYNIDENNFQAHISIPQVAGLDPQITEMLNQKYLDEGTALYESFKNDMESVQEDYPDAHMGIDYTYEIKTNNDRIFALSRVVVNTVGSSSTEKRFDTVDKKTQSIVTLPSLFQQEADYLTAISANIKEQMREQMAADENISYWLDDEMIPENNFQQITADQPFYINADGKLVISFDKYTIAPGYMGSVEFVIPTEVLQPLLADTGLLQ